MADQPVRTRVLARGRWVPFQEFMIRERGEGPVDGVELQGVEASHAPQAVLDAIAGARAVSLGPSNPVISVRTILEVPGISEAVRATRGARRRRVAHRRTARWSRARPRPSWPGPDCPRPRRGRRAPTTGLLDGMVADEPVDGLPTLETDTLMVDAGARRRVAEDVLRFAESLRP